MQCFCGNSSVGRASASQAEGRGFESRFPLKKTDDANHPFFLYPGHRCKLACKRKDRVQKKGMRQHSQFFESAPAASGKGMHSPQGEHNPAGVEGMAEPQSRFPLKLLTPQPLSHEPVVDNISIVTFIYQFPFNKFLY